MRKYGHSAHLYELVDALLPDVMREVAQEGGDAVGGVHDAAVAVECQDEALQGLKHLGGKRMLEEFPGTCS